MEELQGSLLYSIRYDLGGSIVEEGVLDTCLARMREVFPDLRPRLSDLSVFNFSYLARADQKYVLAEEEIIFKGQHWHLRTELDPAGTLGFWLQSPKYEAKEPCELAKRLLGSHQQFLDDKNLDYLIYLSRNGEVRGRLSSFEIPADRGELDFGRRVDQILSLISDQVAQRKRYKFHDFRPIFLLSDDAFASEETRNALVFLDQNSAIKQGCGLNSSATDEPLRGSEGRYVANTWSFVVREQCWTNELEQMFSHAHSHWFQIHGSIFEIRDLEAYIDRTVIKRRELNVAYLQSFGRFLEARKNEMFSSIFAAQNSDFITKNAQYRDDLEIFMTDFGIDKQIGILKDFAERISNYIVEQNNYLSLLESRALNRNTKMLEVLFLLNTAAGIAAFAPSIFSSDIQPEFVFDLPRMLALLILFGSFIFYFGVIFLGSQLSRREQVAVAKKDWMKMIDD